MATVKTRLQRLKDFARRLDTRAGRWLGVAWAALTAALKPEAGIIAAALSYYALLSLFPLTLLSIAIASLSLMPSLGQETIVNQLEFIAPSAGELFGKTFAEISSERGPVTIFSIISLIWAASTFFYTLNAAMRDVWGLEQRPPVWKRRGMAILFVFGFVALLLLMASFAGSALTTLRPWLPDSILWLDGGFSFVLSAALNIGALAVLYRLFPHGKAGWREILPGAISAGLLWEGAKQAFLLFASSYVSARNLIYGSVAGIVAFLFWAYLTAMIFMFGAQVSIAVYRRTKR